MVIIIIIILIYILMENGTKTLIQYYAWFQASTAMYTGSALVLDITQRRGVILRTTYRPISFLTLEDGTDRLSRNVGTQLPLYTA
jgi:hypothetical protein